MKNELIELIEIDTILIANPRMRDRLIHDEIKENIRQIGLKRPITVRMITHHTYKYALICGQGRLEAYVHHGQTHIPAIIRDVDEEVGHLMSLTENIARRKPRATELMERVKQLKKQGLSDKVIGERLGYTANWVQSVVVLLDKGEKKLLAAFESGHIPLYLAVDISRADDESMQNALTEALMNGQIKGRQINIIKRIIENRKKGFKGATNTTYAPTRPQKKYTPEELALIYQQNAEEHKEIQVKAKYVKETLLAVKEIFKNITTDNHFKELLKKNNINDIPDILSKI
ncbi:ParB/RepB/Spo0J family partition protein [Providencia manganoxydans]|uniref:ParB/RepB/Spo0J family partition protein n=1 Tax=Providencia manganoxydans TaxID=2923283 RepID=UPI0029C06367|nr:plasmid partitioning protein RepB C-terminal domain-containing protein [Providencia manganoxydans]MDX4945465.1 plasmid partitioning protein RepB C-terminal domain-containing protein [Providencia manganoxydans]